MRNYTPSKIYETIDSLDIDEFAVYIGALNEDIEALDITRDDYYKTKSQLLQYKCYAWERFSQLQTDRYLGFGKKDNKETNENKMKKSEIDYKALYEQEHKKYGDAVERMKSWMNGGHPECFSEAHKAAEFVFPELAESEEEKLSEKLHQCVCRAINNDKLPYEERKYISEKVIPYLENLEKRKERKPTWSEEDEQNLNASLGYIDDEYLRRWLKDIIHVKYDKLAWSEEDEVMLGNALWTCKEKYCSTETYNWLKSLKDRMTLTNKNDFDRGYDVGISAAKFNQWNPTEEQMKSIARATNRCISVGDAKVLLSLYEDLKKL